MTEVTHTSIVEEYRDGLANGTLLLQICQTCAKPNMYPRYRCPFCQSDQLGWQPANGRGVLHSFTVVRAVPPLGFEDELPYALGVVKLEEGVQLLGRLERSADGDWEGYSCDVAVEFEPRPAEEVRRRPIAWFRLAEGREARDS